MVDCYWVLATGSVVKSVRARIPSRGAQPVMVRAVVYLMPMLILRYQPQEAALGTSSRAILKCDSTAPGSLTLKVGQYEPEVTVLILFVSDICERFGNTARGLGMKERMSLFFVSKSMRLSCVQNDVDVATTTGSVKWSSISAS